MLGILMLYPHPCFRLETRLYRNGVEQPPLVLNPTYDFNFQALHSLRPARQVNPRVRYTSLVDSSTGPFPVAIAAAVDVVAALWWWWWWWWWW